MSPIPVRAFPVALVVGAALSLSLSSTFVRLSGATAGTAAFARCAIALLALSPLAVYEWRRRGPLSRGACWGSAAAGLFLGIDYTMWTASILDVGAGISTVLINVQVVVFPLLCRIFDGTVISRRFAACAPLMLAGIALAGGVLGADAAAPHPVRGTVLGVLAGMGYSAYLYLNRRSGVGGAGHVVVPVAIATAAATGATGVIGAATGGIALALPAAAWGWLVALALLGQVLSWLLLGAATPRLAPGVAASLLLLQPVLAVGFGRLILGEQPTAVQLAGCAAVVVAVWLASTARLGRAEAVEEVGMGTGQGDGQGTGQRGQLTEAADLDARGEGHQRPGAAGHDRQ